MLISLINRFAGCDSDDRRSKTASDGSPGNDKIV